MGSGVGVHTDAEVSDLTPEERELLKQFVVQLLLTSGEVRDIIGKDKDLLPKFMERHADVRQVLRAGTRPFFERLKRR